MRDFFVPVNVDHLQDEKLKLAMKYEIYELRD